MKWRVSFMLLMAFGLTLLVGCAAGGGDARFRGLPSERTTVDGYPVDVTIVRVSETIFDVEAVEGRFIAFTGVNSPLQMYDRFRRGAMEIMKQKFGKNASIKTITELTPESYGKIFIRYEVTP